MFIYSLKASWLKYLFSAIICVGVTILVILLMPDTEHSVSVNGTLEQYKQENISFDGIKDLDGVVQFAKSLGYEVDKEKAEVAQIKIPSKTDAVLEEYNKLQKSQGFNLMKYKNKKAVRYTLPVTGLPNDAPLPGDTVLFTVIICKDKVIGGDVYFTGKNAHVDGILM